MREPRLKDHTRPSEDPFLRAVQTRMATFRAPESLRSRISTMLVIERLRAVPGEPEDDWSR